MRQRSLLERSLAALVGGLIGGFMTLALAFSATTWHWMLWIPTVMGMGVGYWHGDKGITALLKAARWTR